MLFRTRAQPLLSGYGEDKGWSRLAREGVEVKIVQGNHVNMYEDPYALTLANEILAYLHERAAST